VRVLLWLNTRRSCSSSNDAFSVIHTIGQRFSNCGARPPPGGGGRVVCMWDIIFERSMGAK
jgi:hypothetical protein